MKILFSFIDSIIYKHRQSNHQNLRDLESQIKNAFTGTKSNAQPCVGLPEPKVADDGQVSQAKTESNKMGSSLPAIKPKKSLPVSKSTNLMAYRNEEDE